MPDEHSQSSRHELEVLRAYGAQWELEQREQDRVPPPDADLLEHARWIGELRGRRRRVVPARSPFGRVTPEEEFRTALDAALDVDIRQAEMLQITRRVRRKRGLIEYLRRAEPGVSLITHHNTVMSWQDVQVDAMWPLVADTTAPSPALPADERMAVQEDIGRAPEPEPDDEPGHMPPTWRRRVAGLDYEASFERCRQAYELRCKGHAWPRVGELLPTDGMPTGANTAKGWADAYANAMGLPLPRIQAPNKPAPKNPEKP